MTESDWQSDLAGMLAEKGHTPAEVQKIVARVQQYENEMQVDSVMDSIDAGRFDLAAIIKEALGTQD
jgi:hypothetical protein